MRPGLGRIQKAALSRLAAGDLTAADLADTAHIHSAQNSLRILGRDGLAEITGSVPPVSEDGRGKRANVWSITEAGRRVYAAVEARAS